MLFKLFVMKDPWIVEGVTRDLPLKARLEEMQKEDAITGSSHFSGHKAENSINLKYYER